MSNGIEFSRNELIALRGAAENNSLSKEEREYNIRVKRFVDQYEKGEIEWTTMTQAQKDWLGKIKKMAFALVRKK